MEYLNEKFQRFLNILRAAYQSKEHAEVEVSGRWQMDVMRDIRRLGPLRATPNPFLFMNHFVWRFATVACMVVLILSVYMVYTGYSPESEIASLFLDDPVGFTLVQAFGGY